MFRINAEKKVTMFRINAEKIIMFIRNSEFYYESFYEMSKKCHD